MELTRRGQSTLGPKIRIGVLAGLCLVSAFMAVLAYGQTAGKPLQVGGLPVT